MCCKRYHIIFSTFPLNFKCKICVQKDVIPNFKNHILVTWPATNLLILRKWCGLKNQLSIILFKIWPTNRFSKAKSYNFHFHRNDVTWPLSAMAYLNVEIKVVCLSIYTTIILDRDLLHYLLSIKKLKCAFASIELQKMVQFISLRL